MRILYFSRGYTTHDRRFLAGLSNAGHEVYFLRLENHASIPCGVELPPCVRLVRWNAPANAPLTRGDFSVLLPEYKRVLDTLKPDLVQAGPIQSCAWLTAAAGFRPFVAVSWAYDMLRDADLDLASRSTTRFALENADLVVADCEEVKRKIKELGGVPEEQIVQFPWGVDLCQLDRVQPLPSLRTSAADFLVISTRSLETSYGVETLCEGFRLAHKVDPGIRLMILGTGSRHEFVSEFIEHNALTGSVTILGWVSNENLPAYLKACNLYLSCSPVDGSSVSLLEAMAAQLPAIVTDRPSNREWIADGENGWLVPAGDCEALSKALLAASRMPREVLVAIGRRNRRVIEERANWRRNFPKLLEPLERLPRGVPNSLATPSVAHSHCVLTPSC